MFLLFRRGGRAGLVIKDMQTAIRVFVDPVGLGGQAEVQRRQRDAALGFNQDRLAVRPGLAREEGVRGAVQPGAPQQAGGGPGGLFGQDRIGNAQKPHPRLCQGFRPALCDEPFQNGMQHRAARQRIRRVPQRIKRAQAQDVLCIDGIGVADQRLDRRDRQLPGTNRQRRAGGRARCRRNRRRWPVDGGRKGQPDSPPRRHLGKGLRPVAVRQAPHQIDQPVDPARGHGLCLGIADGSAQNNLFGSNGLLVIMR